MHNNVRVIDYGSVGLTCLGAGLLALRKVFSAVAFVCAIPSLYEGLAR